MAEQVLYRKWRPQRFADVHGQDSVVQTLRQAVSQDRVAHAYLFCGPRGTGKTTAARILAKALNCEGLDPSLGPNDGDPDNTCSFCIDVNDGRALDLIEMDAASHRGIDDVRSLQERVFGAGPSRGRAKVYIIDEVHMLTDFAFNALLKTLEEPAPWAYFVLCTTEPHKVLATIISRCQRFDFRRIAPRDVQARLQTVCEGEGYTCEPEALMAIARATGGSARDALNILEQTALSYGNTVPLSGVEELLGLSHDPRALELVRHVLGGNLKESLRVTTDAASGGLEPGPFHREVVERLRAVLLQKSGVGGVEESADDQDAVKAIAASADWNALLRALRLVGRANVRSGEGPAWLPLELAVIEAASPVEELAPTAPVAVAPQPQPQPSPATTAAPGASPADSPSRGGAAAVAGDDAAGGAVAMGPDAASRLRSRAGGGCSRAGTEHPPHPRGRSRGGGNRVGCAAAAPAAHQGQQVRVRLSVAGLPPALRRGLHAGAGLQERRQSRPAAGGDGPPAQQAGLCGGHDGRARRRVPASAGDRRGDRPAQQRPRTPRSQRREPGRQDHRRPGGDAMNRNMMRQAQQLQQRLAKIQEELEQATVEATAGGGMVKAVVTGKQTVASISIDPEAVDPDDVEVLEEMVMAAINEALLKSQELASQKMAAITGGLNIPGLG